MSSTSETNKSGDQPGSQKTNPPEPPTLEFKRLAADCNRGAFYCGDNDIDRWFKNNALQHHNDLKARVVTAHLLGNPAPVGFYATTIRIEPESWLEGRWFSRPQSGYFSSVQLCSVAVHRKMQRQGIGRVMMAYAIKDFYEIVMKTGIFAMTLVALDKEVAKFYEKLGFVQYGDKEATMPRMLLPAQSVVEMIEGR